MEPPMNPYTPPDQNSAPTPPSSGPYSSYDQVPVYRRQWFFWISYILFNPVALILLVFGDIYYQRDGEVRSFGTANRLFAAGVSVYVITKTLLKF